MKVTTATRAAACDHQPDGGDDEPRKPEDPGNTDRVVLGDC
jgi:hypothetical protein